MNAAEVEAMIAAADASGKVLMEGFHYRHHALMKEILAILDSGRLGTVHGAQAIFCTNIRKTPDELRWRADLGGGALMDLGTYALHALRTTMKGEPVVEAAKARVIDGVDARLGATLRFGSVKAHLYCAMRRGPPSPRLRIDGSKASLRVFNFVGPQFGHRLWVGKGFFDFGKSFGGPSTYEAQLAHFLKVIAGEADPLPSLADSLAHMRAIDAIYAAAGMR
jgi:predicted dehydrogenase